MSNRLYGYDPNAPFNGYAISGVGRPCMPRNRPPTAEEIARLEAWEQRNWRS